MITYRLKMSLEAFNGSNNCIRDTADNFYNSYVTRKKDLIKGRLKAIENQDKHVNKKKLTDDIRYLREMIDNKKEAIDLIDRFLNRYIKDTDTKIIEEAEKLVLDIK